MYAAAVGTRMLAFGTTAVGKSTLWKYLQTGQAGGKVEKTVVATPLGDAENPLFRVRDIRVLGVPAGVRAVDVPSDEKFRHTWGPVLHAVKPRVVPPTSIWYSHW